MTLPWFSVNRRNRLQVRAMLPNVNGSSTNEKMFSRHSSGKDKMDTAIISDHASTVIDILQCYRNLSSSFTLKSAARGMKIVRKLFFLSASCTVAAFVRSSVIGKTSIKGGEGSKPIRLPTVYHIVSLPRRQARHAFLPTNVCSTDRSHPFVGG